MLYCAGSKDFSCGDRRSKFKQEGAAFLSASTYLANVEHSHALTAPTSYVIANVSLDLIACLVSNYYCQPSKDPNLREAGLRSKKQVLESVVAGKGPGDRRLPCFAQSRSVLADVGCWPPVILQAKLQSSHHSNHRAPQSNAKSTWADAAKVAVRAARNPKRLASQQLLSASSGVRQRIAIWLIPLRTHLLVAPRIEKTLVENARLT